MEQVFTLIGTIWLRYTTFLLSNFCGTLFLFFIVLMFFETIIKLGGRRQ